jgi:hypothetical protein
MVVVRGQEGMPHPLPSRPMPQVRAASKLVESRRVRRTGTRPLPVPLTSRAPVWTVL